MCCSQPPGCWPPRSSSLPPNAARAFACWCRRWRFALCAFGVLLRPNALIAAPILAAYIAWPTQMSWKRTAILFVPAMAGFFALVQVVYYGALGATRQHPLQSIMVFDLGGISHFTKQNQFPVTWSEPETRAAPELLLPADSVGHLLAAGALRFRDAQDRTRAKAVRHACYHRSLDARGHAPPVGLSPASRGFHVEFPRRQQPHDVGRRRRASRRRPCFRTARPSRAGLAARHAQADAAVPGRLVAAGLHHRVRVRLAATRDARGRVCARRLRIGGRLRAQLLCRRRRVGFPVRLLGGPCRHRGGVVAALSPP